VKDRIAIVREWFATASCMANYSLPNAVAQTLLSKLDAAKEEAPSVRLQEARMLLHRMTKYVREDRAETPGKTRLARLTEQVADYLARTADPLDILREGDAGRVQNVEAKTEATEDEVERVAKAIFHDRYPERAWHSATNLQVEDYRGHARAAIAAMRNK